jgi:hypothetical protein
MVLTFAVSLGRGQAAQRTPRQKSRLIQRLGCLQFLRYHLGMAARSSEQLAHLAQELANLTREERAKVLAHAARLGEPPTPGKFVAPKLSGGTRWIGGELGREHLYGDDGR